VCPTPEEFRVGNVVSVCSFANCKICPRDDQTLVEIHPLNQYKVQASRDTKKRA
jgi:hypothetical protein